MTDDALARVAKAIAAADRGVPGSDDARADDLWDSLSSDEQSRYRVVARVAVEEYLAAVADPG